MLGADSIVGLVVGEFVGDFCGCSLLVSGEGTEHMKLSARALLEDPVFELLGALVRALHQRQRLDGRFDSVGCGLEGADDAHTLRTSKQIFGLLDGGCSPGGTFHFVFNWALSSYIRLL